MSDPDIRGLDQFREIATALMTRLQPRERRAALRAVARALRQSNQRRIAAQVDPDGRAFAPRKPRKADQRRGAVRRRAMFSKLRTARHLRAGASENEAWVEFTGRAARIARVHHAGLMDEVAPGGPRVRYPARPLLGVSAEDEARILDALVEHLEGAGL